MLRVSGLGRFQPWCAVAVALLALSGCFLFGGGSVQTNPGSAPQNEAPTPEPAELVECKGEFTSAAHHAVMSCDPNQLQSEDATPYVSHPCGSGLTPLMLISKLPDECPHEQRLTLTSALLDMGAQVNAIAPCEQGWCTELDFFEQDEAGVAELLRQHGAQTWASHLEAAASRGVSEDAISSAVTVLTQQQWRKAKERRRAMLASLLGPLAQNIERANAARAEHESLSNLVALTHEFLVDRSVHVREGDVYLDTDWLGTTRLRKAADHEWERSSGAAYTLTLTNKSKKLLLVDVRVSISATQETRVLFSESTHLNDMAAELVHVLIPPGQEVSAAGFLPLTATSQGLLFDADELKLETESRVFDVAEVSTKAVRAIKKVADAKSVTEVSSQLMASTMRGDRKLGFVLRMQWERAMGPLQQPDFSNFRISAKLKDGGSYDPDFPQPYVVEFVNARPADCYVHWRNADGVKLSRSIPANSTETQKCDTPKSGAGLDVQLESVMCDSDPVIEEELLAAFLPIENWSVPGAAFDDACVVFGYGRSVVLSSNPKHCWIGTWDGNFFKSTFPPSYHTREVSVLDSPTRNVVRLVDTQGVTYVSSLGGVAKRRFVMWEETPR